MSSTSSGVSSDSSGENGAGETIRRRADENVTDGSSRGPSPQMTARMSTAGHSIKARKSTAPMPGDKKKKASMASETVFQKTNFLSPVVEMPPRSQAVAFDSPSSTRIKKSTAPPNKVLVLKAANPDSPKLKPGPKSMKKPLAKTPTAQSKRTSRTTSVSVSPKASTSGCSGKGPQIKVVSGPSKARNKSPKGTKISVCKTPPKASNLGLQPNHSRPDSRTGQGHKN